MDFVELSACFGMVVVTAYLSKEALSLPSSVRDLWIDYLAELQPLNLVSLLLIQILSEACISHGLRQKMLYSWTALILESANSPSTGEDGTVRLRL